MRKAFALFTCLAALSACQSDQQASAPAASHTQLVASLNGAYLWDCTVTNEAGTAQTQFVLEQRIQGAYPKVFLRVAGRTHAEEVGVTTKGAAQVFALRDTSKILIASDGEVVGEGRNTSIGDTYPKGQCRRGQQGVAS